MNLEGKIIKILNTEPITCFTEIGCIGRVELKFKKLRVKEVKDGWLRFYNSQISLRLEDIVYIVIL